MTVTRHECDGARRLLKAAGRRLHRRGDHRDAPDAAGVGEAGHVLLPAKRGRLDVGRRGARIAVVLGALTVRSCQRRKPELEHLAERATRTSRGIFCNSGRSRHVAASSLLRLLRCRPRSRASAPRARSGSATATVSSSFSSNDRLSKFAEPMTLHTPSTIIALTCIIVGWYS